MVRQISFTAVAGVSAAVLILLGPSAQAQTTIYKDTFNGVMGDMNGSTPTVTTGGATWSSPVVSASGTIVNGFVETPSGSSAPGKTTVTGNFTGNNTTNNTLGPSAYLPFTVASLASSFPGGAIIDLSVVMNPTTELNGTSGNDWLAVGFTQNQNVASDPSQAGVAGQPWLIDRVNGGAQYFQGPYTTNGSATSATGTFTGPTQFDIVINTLTNNESFYAGGTNTTALYSVAASATGGFGNINFVTLAAHRASGSFSSFSLTAISAASTPEPGSVVLALSAGLPLLGVTIRRRMRAARR